MGRLKHEMRRSAIVAQRVAERELRLGHIPDACNFVDPFTKWKSFEKVAAAMCYLYGTAKREGNEPAHCLLAALREVGTKSEA